MGVEAIGVVGLGDLGGQIVRQNVWCGVDVVGYDKKCSGTPVNGDGLSGIDPHLRGAVGDNLGSLSMSSSVTKVIELTDMTHWAVPSTELDSVPDISESDKTIVLHDSVMSNSKHATRDRRDAGNFVIAHCLMNEERKVILAEGFGPVGRVNDHMSSLGLDVVRMSIEEHDRMMAESQGEYARLIIERLTDLRALYSKGLLTPSSKELLAALEHREGKWTLATLESILSNPYVEVDKEALVKYRSIKD